MADPRGTVTLKDGSKEWPLRFSTNAMCRFEADAGESIIASATRLQDGDVTFTSLRLFLAAGLGVSVEEAGDVMDAVGFAQAMQKVAEAFALALPAEDESSSGDEPEVGNGKGRG